MPDTSRARTAQIVEERGRDTESFLTDIAGNGTDPGGERLVESGETTSYPSAARR
jgi:hypothetical protein